MNDLNDKLQKANFELEAAYEGRKAARRAADAAREAAREVSRRLDAARRFKPEVVPALVKKLAAAQAAVEQAEQDLAKAEDAVERAEKNLEKAEEKAAYEAYVARQQQKRDEGPSLAELLAAVKATPAPVAAPAAAEQPAPATPAAEQPADAAEPATPDEGVYVCEWLLDTPQSNGKAFVKTTRSDGFHWVADRLPGGIAIGRYNNVGYGPELPDGDWRPVQVANLRWFRECEPTPPAPNEPATPAPNAPAPAPAPSEPVAPAPAPAPTPDEVDDEVAQQIIDLLSKIGAVRYEYHTTEAWWKAGVLDAPLVHVLDTACKYGGSYDNTYTCSETYTLPDPIVFQTTRGALWKVPNPAGRPVTVRIRRGVITVGRVSQPLVVSYMSRVLAEREGYEEVHR